MIPLSKLSLPILGGNFLPPKIQIATGALQWFLFCFFLSKGHSGTGKTNSVPGEKSPLGSYLLGTQSRI